MRWDMETWRKVYTGKPASWIALPVSARGLGRELLTYVDDEGRLLIGDEAPGAAVARLLSAHRGEYKRIDLDVAALLQDGYLLLEGPQLRIRNFVKAQERASSAERQARYRARQRGDQSDRNALRVTPASRGDAPNVTGDAYRSDGYRDRRSEPPNPRQAGGFGDGAPEPSGTPRQRAANPRANGTNPRAIGAPPPPPPLESPPPPPARAAVLETQVPTGTDLTTLAAGFGRPAPEAP